MGTAAVLEDAYFKEIVGKIVKTREWTKGQLKKLGFSFGDSMSNFLFVTAGSPPTISPINRQLVWRGKCSNAGSIIKDSPTSAIPIPIKIGIKNFMLSLNWNGGYG